MTSAPGPLAPYRVLELPGVEVAVSGQMLAGLGAEVIKVEPPAGDLARRQGPFLDDRPGRERSLFWLATATGKRSITLALTTADGRALLERLVAQSDFLVEGYPPGYLPSLGLGYEHLRPLNPGLIMASVTPFGQSGPWAGCRGPDIVPWALSGYMALCGDGDRPPVRISLPPQAYFHAASMATVGLLIALQHRAQTGEGQHVDQAAQPCGTWMLTHTLPMREIAGITLTRQGSWRQFGPARRRTVFACRDGHVVWIMLGGHVGARAQRLLSAWAAESMDLPDWLPSFDWEGFSAAQADQEAIDTIVEVFSRFFLTKTKAELLEFAVANAVMLAPVNSPLDLLADPQLAAREFWQDVPYPEWGRTLRHPGAPIKLSATPWRPPTRAPRLGEHNRAVYVDQLGLSLAELTTLKGAGVI